MAKLPYSEGSVFLVPLRGDGFGRGVIARSSNKGRVLLGYFFGPRLKSTGEVTIDDLAPGNAVLRLRFGDLGLINGEWPVVGTIVNWQRAEWPMPDCVRRDPLSKKSWLVRYADDDPNRVETEVPIGFDSKLDADSMFGYGAVEIVLTNALEN